MEQAIPTGTRPDRPVANLLFVLVMLQASNWFLAAIADYVFGVALGSPLNFVMATLTLAATIFAIALASGLVRGKRWAAYTAIGLETVLLSGTLLAAVAAGLLHVKVPTSLLALIFNIGVPLAVLVLASRQLPDVRRTT
jgi:hypothetical protein